MRSNRFKIILFIISVTALCLIALVGCGSESAEYALNYSASTGGYIEGDAEQAVAASADGTPVKAVADKGYRFIKWSDGEKTAQRQDKNVTSSKKVTAEFAPYYTLTYSASAGGHIKGETKQEVIERNNGALVEAVAEKGYRFIQWSDGVRARKRQAKRVTANKNVTAEFEPIGDHSLTYIADIGGHIEGEANQELIDYFAEEPTAVQAVADDGYVFVGWSDGFTGAERHDTYLKQYTDNFSRDFAMTAYFEPKEKVFHYNYGGTTSDKTVTVMRDNPQASVFATPAKDGFEFGGWYADKELKVRVTDENGRLMYGYNTVTLETDTLYARWMLPQKPTGDADYRILLTVVGGIDAKLRKRNMQYEYIEYKMPMVERILCKQIAPRMSACLNEWFAGKVKFEIDTYFTMQDVITEEFDAENNSLDPRNMREVRDMYDKYDMHFVLLNINDYSHKFRANGDYGVVSGMRCCLYLDECLMNGLFRDMTISEWILQGKIEAERRWDLIETCLIRGFTDMVAFKNKYGDLYETDVILR